MRVVSLIVYVLAVMAFLIPEARSIHSDANGLVTSSFSCQELGCEGGQSTCVVMDVPTWDHSDFCTVTCYESGGEEIFDEPLEFE